MYNEIEQEYLPIKFGTENNKLGEFPFVLKVEDIDNDLKILIAGAVKGEPGGDNEDLIRFIKHYNLDTDANVLEKLNGYLTQMVTIYPNQSEMYEITFRNYIIYQVRNESYCTYDDYEIRRGKNLIIFDKSRLLDYFLSVTICCKLDNDSYFPGKWKHFGVYSEDHLIDIITDIEPEIRKIARL